MDYINWHEKGKLPKEFTLPRTGKSVVDFLVINPEHLGVIVGGHKIVENTHGVAVLELLTATESPCFNIRQIMRLLASLRNST